MKLRSARGIRRLRVALVLGWGVLEVVVIALWRLVPPHPDFVFSLQGVAATACALTILVCSRWPMVNPFAWDTISSRQAKRLGLFLSLHPGLHNYCARVINSGRQIRRLEYQAMRRWASAQKWKSR